MTNVQLFEDIDINCELEVSLIQQSKADCNPITKSRSFILKNPELEQLLQCVIKYLHYKIWNKNVKLVWINQQNVEWLYFEHSSPLYYVTQVT